MNDVSNPPTVAPATTEIDDFLGVKPKSPRRKWIVRGVLALIAIALILLIARWFTATEEAGYVTERVERGPLTVTVSATGNLQPTNEVEVGSEQSGIILQVFVDNNDRVTRGQPLARLDTARLTDAVVQAQAGLAAADAGVGQAQATVTQARANLGRLEEVFRISGGRVPSRVELDTGRAENARAIAGVRAAQAQVAQARAQLSSAQTNLAKATIYSPVNGVVLSRQFEPGQTVAASFNAPVLFVIAEDLGTMELEVKVDEADVAQVKEGQRATFTVDAFPGRSFPAQIERVDVGANASGTAATTTATTAAGTVVAYTAVLTLANPELLLRPGMTATAEIVTSEKQNVLLVPNAALRFDPDRASNQRPGGVTGALTQGPGRRNRAEREVAIGRGSRRTIYTLDAEGKPRPIEVTVGETNGSLTEVAGRGLRPGMAIVTGQRASEGGGSSGSGGRGGGGGRQRGG